MMPLIANINIENNKLKSSESFVVLLIFSENAKQIAFILATFT